MRLKGWRLRLSIAVGVLVLAVVLAIAFVGPLLHAAVAFGGRAAGYDVSYATLRNHAGHLTIEHPDVASLGGEPVFTASRIDVGYSLKDVFGGPYLYGISGIEIDRPKLTLVHHKDGSYNILIPKSDPNAKSKPLAIPQIHAVVKDGSFGIVDQTRIFAHSRRIAIENVQLDADLHPKGRSLVSIGLAILEDGGKFPLSGRGTLDEQRGFELTRIRAKSLALAPLIDYALNSPTLHVANGVLNDIDARIWGLPGHDGSMQRHVSVTANLDHFQPYLGGIAKPLRDGRGALRVYDDGLAIPKVDGSIAGIPVRISGAIYDLSAPRLRLGIAGKGDLGRLLTLSDAAKKLPLSGPLAFSLFVEGAATLPTTFVTFSSPRVHYAAFPLDGLSGLVALRGTQTAIVRAGLAYDGIAIGARGRILATKHTDIDMLANVRAPVRRLPYATQLLGSMDIGAHAVATGVDANLETSGVLGGSDPAHTLAGVFDVDGRGIGTIGPIALSGPSGSRVFADVGLDRPRGGGGAGVVSLDRFHFSTRGPQPALPGLALAQAPPADVNLDADLAGALESKRFALGGTAHAYRSRVLGYPIDDVTARANVTTGNHLALQARYRGALEPLAAASGGKIVAHGRVDIPVTVVADSATSAVAQISGARFDGARVGTIRLDGLDATVGIRGKAFDVYAARARIDGNDIVARGSFGNGGTLDVSAGGIDLRALRSLGLPVRSGVITAVASIGGTPAAPRVRGGIAASDVTLPNPNYTGLAVSASTALGFDGDALTLEDALVRAGPAVASLDGSVHGLRRNPAAARYAFDARLRQADIGTLAHVAKAPVRYPEGTLDADLHVAGSGSSPGVTGDISIPEGSVNGLRFRDAGVALRGTPSALAARGGHVTIGQSVLGFSAAAARNAQSFALHAPRVDLADLNDYFDQGDTLGGTGSIDVAVRNTPDRIVANGRVRLMHTRFRRFDLGSTRADVATAGRRIGLDVALGTTAGQVAARGSIGLPATQPLRNTLARSTLAFDTRATGVDLRTWLPAAGIVAPVVGFVDANAHVTGTYPDVGLTAHAALSGGMVRGIPIRTAAVDLNADAGRVTVSRALFAIDNASATASGSAGIRPGAPLDLSVLAQSPDIGLLAKSLGVKVDAAGALATTLRLTGTQQAPLLSDSLDLTSLRYERFVVPRAHLEASVSKTRATLRTAEVDLQKGRLLATGSVPLQTQPTAGVPETAPLNLGLTADHVDLAQFAQLLPKGTQAAGVLGGNVGLIGTRARPGLRGDLALSGGSFVGPQLRSRVTDGVAEVVFADRTVTLRNTHATVGGGTIAASGSVTVPDLRDPAASASANLALVSTNAVLDAPKYIRGRINGTVNVVHPPGGATNVGGTVAFTSTRIPTTALLPSGGASPAATAAPLPVNFDLGVDVGDDVRVQGGPVDIGAKGHLQVGGTLAAPTVSGLLDSTGGTLSFYRTFRVEYPTTVSFDPSNGVIPNVDALATTTVDNPPTDVTLHVTGAATSLNVAFTSDPSYSREQILGLLVGAQALGAVSGVATTNGGGPQQNPFQAAAEGQLGGLLTQNILEPFSSQLGSAVGLNNLALNYSPGGGASVGAQKKIFKNVNAIFADSFGTQPRQSIGLRDNPNDATALQLTFFSQPSSNRFDVFQGSQNLLSTNQSLTNAEPASGSNGFSVSFQKKFR